MNNFINLYICETCNSSNLIQCVESCCTWTWYFKIFNLWDAKLCFVTGYLIDINQRHVWWIYMYNITFNKNSSLIKCLAVFHQVAARTLGDLVKKLGERVLPEIIPILEKGLDSDRADQRQGVCIGLSEIMKATSREHVKTQSLIEIQIYPHQVHSLKRSI